MERKRCPLDASGSMRFTATMIFKDRYEAGKLLVAKLRQYEKAPNVVVIGLPRGGVATAFEVAQGLNLPLDVICARKIGAPFNPELAIGAVTETGDGILNTDLIAQLGIDQAYLQSAAKEQQEVAQRRAALYRKNFEKIPLQGKTVLLVDDGIATGATMEAAIKSMREEEAARIIIAVPVAPRDTFNRMNTLVDEVISLSIPDDFYAVGQFYKQFNATEDEEVVKLLQRASQSKG